MTTRPLRGGTYNCERGRDPSGVVDFVAALMGSKDLDYLCLQESQDYVSELRALRAYRLICPRVDAAGKLVDGAKETSILVRRGVAIRDVRRRRLGRVGWITVRGGRVPARSIPLVLLNGWLTVGSIHAPPSVRLTGRRPRGPRMRVRAFGNLSRRLVTICRRINGPYVIAGDWNEPASSRGLWSPRWVATKLDAQLHTAGGIDYAMTHGLRVEDFRRLSASGGSDHDPVIFTVRPKA